MFKRIIQQQQQQQHSLLSQASWGRLEVKPKKSKKKTEKELEESRKESKDHGSGTLIASLQALLSIAKFLEIFHSLRSLITDSSQVSLGRPLPLLTLLTRCRTPLRTGTSGGLRWTWRLFAQNHLQNTSSNLQKGKSSRTQNLYVKPQWYPPRS